MAGPLNGVMSAVASLVPPCKTSNVLTIGSWPTTRHIVQVVRLAVGGYCCIILLSTLSFTVLADLWHNWEITVLSLSTLGYKHHSLLWSSIHWKDCWKDNFFKTIILAKRSNMATFCMPSSVDTHLIFSRVSVNFSYIFHSCPWFPCCSSTWF